MNMGNFMNQLNNYQVIPRDLIFDNTMSDRARFLFCYMASKPEGWDFFLSPMAKEIGYTEETLRKYINELVSSGWLTKGVQHNEGGRWGAVSYTLNSEKTSTGNTDTEKNRLGKNHTQRERDLEDKDNNKKNINNNIVCREIITTKFDLKQELINLGVEEQVAHDWMVVRKQKKASNTLTAFNKIKKQIEMSNLTPTECITIAVERNWMGFEAEWVSNLSSERKSQYDRDVYVKNRIAELDKQAEKYNGKVYQ